MWVVDMAMVAGLGDSGVGGRHVHCGWLGWL